MFLTTQKIIKLWLTDRHENVIPNKDFQKTFQMKWNEIMDKKQNRLFHRADILNIFTFLVNLYLDLNWSIKRLALITS